ncbi:hypothetical protein [Aureicoccus marinus]|uniref:Uncharacterized protein n=1 Tax=Aureicoccus marinus TaxID=754435 RepID=A0A2S7TAL9_9FLAO|nr:hypothetical protein [Aureicoccus marinus]PQJ16575.1 hypothetical protein BST99_13355 [Aureicoccus marinus]
MRTLIFIGFIFLSQACSQEPKIVITKEHIVNKYWDDDRNNSILIEKMMLKKDSVLDIFSSDFRSEIPNHWNIINKLEVDSTSYFGYSGLNIKKDKKKLNSPIFFNKNNGFEWYSANGNKTIIGNLETNTWYKFSNLTTSAYYVYIYVDKEGKTHRFNVNMSNY